MKIQTAPSKTEVVEELVKTFDSKFFKTLSEPVRVQIIKFILLNGRADIGTIADHMPQDRSVISRHLSLLYEVGILNCEKENRHVFYEINGQAFIEKLENITEQIRKSIPECCPSCLT